MAEYRKKPILIEAIQLNMYTRWNNCYWPTWLNIAWHTEGEGGVWPDSDKPNNPEHGFADDLCVGTKEGVMRCPIGWYIIKGIAGELYSCDPNIFNSTYDMVEETECQTK